MLKSILILFVGMVCAVSQTVFGQTTVTFIIDATDFVNSGGVLAGNKVSMAGTLSDRGGALPNWQPGSTLMTPTSTPTIYSRTITFTGPGVTADSLEWKYVQGTGWADGDEGNEWPIPPPASCVKGANNNRKIMLPASGNWIISSKWAQCAVLTAAPQVATVTTNAITGIAQTFAVGGGNVTNSGGGFVTARGVCWSTTPQPNVDLNTKTTDGTGPGAFTSNITGLLPNTQYYVRAYATNSDGTAYGSEQTFTTLALPPVKVTYKVDITNYLAGGATLGANGIRIGGNFTTRGASLPDWTPSAAACAMSNLGNNIWSITVTYPDSSKGKVQKYKFVNNDWGTNEGSDSLVAGGCGVLDGTDVNRILTIPTSDDTVSFCWDRCNACFIPVLAAVTTDPTVTLITQTSATVSGGSLGEGITKKGICYSINQNPTIADSLRSVGSGAGNFSGNLTGLTANTTYYARAYATNGAGTAYGAQVSFTTLANPQGPSVKVTYRVNITNYLLGGATLGANGIRIGGNFTTRGASLPDWTPSAAACAMSNLGNNIWSITVTYPDSSKGKVQKYKFVNNDWGTNEGSDSLVAGGCGVLDGTDVNRILTIPTSDDTVSFCWDRCNACFIPVLAAVTTDPTVTLITQTSATVSGGSLGEGITKKGICYSINQNPTIADSLRSVGSGAGNFSGNLTGLTANTTYYARAYATNGAGTAYGLQVSFTTLANPQGPSVKVTYRVNITNYLLGGATLGANGIRIGGNFTTRGASLPDWTPSAAACAMSNLGNNIWSITVTYPDTAKGKVQRYKFVNNDWGTNEGSDSLVAGGCGVLDGTDVNRILTIPTSDDTVSFCWDRCGACILVGVEEVTSAETFRIFPNPVQDEFRILIPARLNDAQYLITNILGETVAEGKLSGQETSVSSAGLSQGAYFIRIPGESKALRILKL